MPRMRTVAAAMAALTTLAVPASAAGLTPNEQAERQMTKAINAVRAEHGLPAFRHSASLTASAERYSQYLMAHDVFAHQSSIWASSRFALLGEALEWHSGRRFDVRGSLRRWLASPVAPRDRAVADDAAPGRGRHARPLRRPPGHDLGAARRHG